MVTAFVAPTLDVRSTTSENLDALQLHCGARGLRCCLAFGSAAAVPHQGLNSSSLTASTIITTIIATAAATITSSSTANPSCIATALSGPVPWGAPGGWEEGGAVQVSVVEEVSYDTPLCFLCRWAAASGHGWSMGTAAAAGWQRGRRLLREGVLWAGRKRYGGGGGGGVLPQGDASRKRSGEQQQDQQQQQQVQQQQGGWLPVMPWQQGRGRGDPGSGRGSGGGGGELSYDSAAAAAANDLTALLAQQSGDGCKWVARWVSGCGVSRDQRRNIGAGWGGTTVICWINDMPGAARRLMKKGSQLHCK